MKFLESILNLLKMIVRKFEVSASYRIIWGKIFDLQDSLSFQLSTNIQIENLSNETCGFSIIFKKIS